MTKHGREMRARMRRAVPWEENSLRAGRKGQVRGATYEQATGEEPRPIREVSGSKAFTIFGRPRKRRRR